jgi:phosphoserine phosphatase RsbU/P
MKHVNRILHLDIISSMFVKCFYGVLNIKTGEIECSNGGHNPPYIVGADGSVREKIFHPL